MRKLIFPLTELRDDASLEQQTDGVVPEYQILPWPTNDQFEPVVFIGQLSLRQFIQLTSAIDVGRDIAYPDESSQIWLDWVRFIEGFVTVDCADVLTCILNDPAIMEAIIEKLIGAGFSKNGSVPPAENIGDERFPPSERQSDIKELQNCNLDALWGGIRSGIVKYLDDTARTLLEDLIVQQDKAERAALFIESLPVFGEVAASAILNVTESAEDLLNLFNGYSSESSLDQIACDLFQLCCSQCRYPTFDEVFDYYRNLGIQDFTDFAQVTANLLIDYLIGSSQATQQAAYFTIIAAGVLVPLYLETKVKNLLGGKKQLEIWANVGEDFASDNWNVLCGGCVQQSWEVMFDFTQSQNGFDFSEYCTLNDVGTYVLTEGFKTIGNLRDTNCTLKSGWRIVDIGYLLTGSNSTITEVSVNYDVTKGNGFTQLLVSLTDRVVGGTQGDVIIMNKTPLADGTNLTETVVVNQSVNKPRIRIRLWAQETSGGGTGTIKSVTIKGTGDNPF